MKAVFLRSLMAGAVACVPAVAIAQSGSESAGIVDIVVTAQKRAQALNDVGLTISAASGDTLLQRGITDTADLGKIVPGFTATASPYATPVYTLRGIGLYDYSFGSAPSVAVYVDEIARPFPVTQMGVTLDLERAEVLKGPQGTLFGQSATGGAINYIAAKPTDTFQAGADLSYERFGKMDASGFVSGPLSDTLKARLAVRAVEGGAWQYSVSRPDDKNGDTKQLMGRLLVDWEPTDRLRFALNINGMRDRSDTQQAQFISNQLNVVGAPGSGNPFERVDPAAFAALTTPGSANFDGSFVDRQAVVFGRLTGLGFAPGAMVTQGDAANQAAYLGGPNGDGSALCTDSSDRCIRQAEWSNDWPTSSNDRYWQVALRTDYDLTDDLTLTSLTSFQQTKINKYFDNDATTAGALNEQLFGSVKSFSQELRVSGRNGGLNWIVGGNYDWSKIEDNVLFRTFDLSLNEVFPGARFDGLNSNIKQTIKNYAAFANADFEVTPNFTIQGGIRYTKSTRRAATCNTDTDPEQYLSGTFGNPNRMDLQTVFGAFRVDANGNNVDNPNDHRTVLPGQCYVLNANVAPDDPAYLRPIIDPWQQKLTEDNVSFRVGASYKFDGGTLLYATLSQGYKSGIISGVSPSTTSQYIPATQEKVLAYEAGFKAPLFDRKIQLNAAGFYYDYSDKQVRARVRDDIFGLLETLVNVPKSYIWGLEAELLAQPVEGLSLSWSGTYLKSKVTSSFDSVGGRALYNQGGYTGDFMGSPLTFTPNYSSVFDGQYQTSFIGGVDGFVGTTITYTSRDNATFYNDVVKADGYFRREHTLLDMRAGLADPDGGWRLTFFARNLTNEYYETTIFTGIESSYRYSGRPRTFGLQLSVRTK
ncbi:MAG: TonB-dependent receptor [Sphingobium sp.]